MFQPGIYNLTGTIKVTKPDTVLYGLGMATLVSTTGQTIIDVAGVDGVRVSSVLLQAGQTKTETLLKFGDSNHAGTAANPGVLSDVFARVGGPDPYETSAGIMVQVNSGNVVIDNTWLWRADHSVSGLV